MARKQVKFSYVKWLRSNLTEGKRYRHNFLQENTALTPKAKIALRRLVNRAHADTISHLRQIWEYSLDPLGEANMDDPAQGYPDALPDQTLMGYFGEILGAIVAEEFPPFQENWEVPCFLFRFHDQAFQALERYRQAGEMKKRIVGRTGDDFLAFCRDGSGEVTKVLVFESKCLQNHVSTKAKEAHENLSDEVLVPVSIAQVVQILKESQDPEVRAWIPKLQALRLKKGPGCERYDCLVYIRGNNPTQTTTWIPTNQPHSSYTGKRKLEVVEVYLSNVSQLVDAVYRGGVKVV